MKTQETKKTQENKLELVSNIVNYIYQFELFQKRIDVTYCLEDDLFTKEQIQVIEKIARNYPKLRNVIMKFVRKDWKWTRLQPLVRAILIVGAYEMIGRDSASTINGMVMITKAFVPDNKSYKFVNAILDKVGKLYDELKTSKAPTEDK